MKIISWNINGIRSNILSNGSMGKKIKPQTIFDNDCNLKILIDKYNPDILCFQETRCDKEIGDNFQFPEYPYMYWNGSQGEGARGPKRYSGTSIWSKIKPICEDKDAFPNDKEGRFIKLCFEHFDLINVYTPNSGSNYEYRISSWDKTANNILSKSEKLTIYTGDLNVVSDDIDIYNPHYLKEAKMAGCLKDERENFKMYLSNFKDVFRELNKSVKKYSWWNMRTKARISNRGWRIDYFLANDLSKCKSCDILTEIMGSDHCPIILEVDY